ncbi:hypothetical protein J2Z35_002656 [Acetoanaerobium pronyense]|uniref:Uncharacterized protein n=1 Tax=Acetoanaerobium pronyense TaxID=1482736 RepID=A0ABS4KQD7_9FIRM|nr:hypothetical protein [Acetoanaerobium pronyense]MBP2028819.1 hypothetical protein [Acetoanaerobium pronyense]
MNRYTKVNTLKGTYYTKDYEKKKKNMIKIRKVLEETVRKFFKNRDAEVLVYFEETEKEILITPDSPPEDIKKYLGEKFLG